MSPVGNRPVCPGTRATKLLVTNVINPVMPLVHYERTVDVTVLDFMVRPTLASRAASVDTAGRAVPGAGAPCSESRTSAPRKGVERIA